MRALVAVVVALAAGPSLAEAQEFDRWEVDCATDAMTDQRSCRLMYLTDVPDALPGTFALAAFGWLPDGRLIFTGGLSKYNCPKRPVMVRVDRNQAVTLEAVGHNYFLDPAGARDMAGQFKAGNSALMRVHVFPDCLPQDLSITLKGFTAAWKRFEAEGG